MGLSGKVKVPACGRTADVRERENLCFPSDTKNEATRADPAAQCLCSLGSSFPKVLQDTKDVVSVYRNASMFKPKLPLIFLLPLKQNFIE